MGYELFKVEFKLRIIVKASYPRRYFLMAKSYFSFMGDASDMFDKLRPVVGFQVRVGNNELV